MERKGEKYFLLGGNYTQKIKNFSQFDSSFSIFICFYIMTAFVKINDVVICSALVCYLPSLHKRGI